MPQIHTVFLLRGSEISSGEKNLFTNEEGAWSLQRGKAWPQLTSSTWAGVSSGLPKTILRLNNSLAVLTELGKAVTLPQVQSIPGKGHR